LQQPKEIMMAIAISARQRLPNIWVMTAGADSIFSGVLDTPFE